MDYPQENGGIRTEYWYKPFRTGLADYPPEVP